MPYPCPSIIADGALIILDALLSHTSNQTHGATGEDGVFDSGVGVTRIDLTSLQPNRSAGS